MLLDLVAGGCILGAEVFLMRSVYPAIFAILSGCSVGFDFIVSVYTRDTNDFSIVAEGEAFSAMPLDDGRLGARLSRHFSSYDVAKSDGEFEFSINESDMEIFRRRITPGICDESTELDSEELVYSISIIDGVAEVKPPIILCRDGDRVSPRVE